MLVDYAFPLHPSTAALRAAGATGVSRYLSRRTPAALGKIVTAQEYQQLLADGFEVVLNWEYDARDYLGGAMAGANHAREAINQATALGYPRGCVIIGSADADVSRADWLGTGRPYYYAFSTGLRIAGYRPGIYGPYDVLTWAREDDVADIFWQAGMSTAWSQGRNRNLWPGAHLRQRRQVIIDGADCDVSDIIQADYGQTGGTNMAISDADWALALRLIKNIERVVTYSTDSSKSTIPGLDYGYDGQGATHMVPNPTVLILDTIKALQLAGPLVDLDEADRVTIVAGLTEALAPLIPTPAQIATAVLDEQHRRDAA